MEIAKKSVVLIKPYSSVKKPDIPKCRPMSVILRILMTASMIISAGVLVALIGCILINGIPALIKYSPSVFSWEYTSENVSMTPAIINTLIITAISLIIAVPVGISAAIYLTEYAKKGSRLVKLIRIAAETLSGIPSIVYGLFGYLFFVLTLGMGYSMISGAVTLAIMILPLIIRTTEEALLSVPDSYREGSFGLGAGRLRTIFHVVLPSAVPGITAGVILAAGRIVGESAALIFTAGTFAAVPDSLTDSARTLSVHMYALLSEGLYTEQAFASAVFLLLVVIGINALSKYAAKKLTDR
ncbi:MAG: phosphate ABC transporter permease PstA [Oscillospiraceae bacterium]|nr:phosphate ABC transporter permease PstA [Oscillospiraceae bacterium]